MVRSGIEVLDITALSRSKSIEEEDVLVVAGRGVRSAEGVALTRRLAEALGGQLCFTRPMCFCPRQRMHCLRGRSTGRNLPIPVFWICGRQ